MSSDLKDRMGPDRQILKGRDYPAVGTVSSKAMMQDMPAMFKTSNEDRVVEVRGDRRAA